MAKTLVYRIWPFSWFGLSEITDHLARVKKLGVDYVWLGPIYELPNYCTDRGVDGYKVIDHRFDTMKEFEAFVSTAHKLGLKILMELSLDPTYPYATSEPDYWFINGSLNWRLMKKFKGIVKFWLKKQVDGFSLSLSKNVDKAQSKFPDVLSHQQANTVIYEIFGDSSASKYNGEKPFLIMECFDPTCGNLTDSYCYVGVDFIMNSAVRNAIDDSREDFNVKLATSTKSPNFMLSLESPNSPRFTTRSGLLPAAVAEIMFESGAQGICLYQGQEIGAENDTRSRLSLRRYQEHPYGLFCYIANNWVDN